MKKALITLVIVALGLVGLGCSGMFPRTATAITNICDDQGDFDEELLIAAGCKLEEEDTAIPLVINLIQVVLGLVGVLTVGMIVYGGITYVISTGDAMKIRRAQNTIIYGIVGMVIASLAYAIVYFVSKSVWG